MGIADKVVESTYVSEIKEQSAEICERKSERFMK